MQDDAPKGAGINVIAVHDFVVLTDLEDAVRAFDASAELRSVTGLPDAVAILQTADPLASSSSKRALPRWPGPGSTSSWPARAAGWCC